MSPTVNFTGTVEKDLLKRLKVIAAKLATSINDSGKPLPVPSLDPPPMVAYGR